MSLRRAEAARRNGRKGGRPRKDGAPTRTAEARSPKPLENPFGLLPRKFLFVEAYCGRATFNAVQAAKLAGYKGGDAHACRLAARGRAKQAIDDRVARKAVELGTMDGEEALLRMSRFARGDIRLLFPEGHPIRNLPDEVALCIKAVRPGPYGMTIEFHDALRATEIMLKVTGKLTGKHEDKHAHMTLAELVGLSMHPKLAEMPVDDDEA